MSGKEALPTHEAHDSQERRHGALASAVRVVSGMTFLSRLGGMVRDVILVRVFGGTAIGSAFTAGFAIPNMFRRLFGEGALSAAFIPEYASSDKNDPGQARRFASLVVGLLAIVTGLLTAGIELLLMLALLLLPGNPERELSIRLIMLMLPFMPFICVAAILGGMLQVHGRFGPAASGPLVLNGFIIAVGAWHLYHHSLGGEMTAYALGAATVLSGLTQAGWFLFVLRRHVSWTRDVAPARDQALRMLRKLVPVLIGMGTLQITALVDQLIAMWPIWIGPTLLGREYPLDKASNIILAAAQRLYQFPLGVFGIAVATAAFPMLARHADEPAAFVQTLRRGIRLSLFIGLPASIGLFLVRDDAIPLLYRFGGKGFSPEQIGRAAAVLAGYAPGIWAYSLIHVLTRAFYARGDTRTPMRVALGMVALATALNWTLIWFLREAGLGWSTSITATVQSLVLAVLCRRQLRERLLDTPTFLAIIKLLVAAAVMGFLVWVLLRSLPAPLGWRDYTLRLVGACVLGGLAYPGAALLLRCHEPRWLLWRHREEKAAPKIDGSF